MVKPGWVEATIGAFVDNKQISIQTGPFGTVLSASEYVDHGIPVISVREIRQGYIQLFDETPAVSSLTYRKLPQFALEPFDLVFARKGSVDRSALIPENSQKLFLGSDGIRLRFSNPILAQIVFHCVQSSQTRQFLTVSAYGTTMAGLNETIISSIPISIPCDSKEQQRIAEALSDVDELIASLEKLIEKKEAIKQGAMQELLTGKRRLPGFSGEWEEKRLGDICKIVMGQSPDSKFYNNDRKGLPLIQGNADIENRKTIMRSYTTQVTKKAYCGEIIFTVRAPVGNVARATFDCCLGRGVCALRDAPPLIYQTLIFLEPHWKELSSGSTFDSISTDTLENTKVFLPKDMQEGNCISLILDEMDKEIRDIGKKLEKSLSVKQGMMQQLLEGKFRIV